MSAQALPVGYGSLVSGIARITGRYRLPSDIVSELKHVLAENPKIVILDLYAVAGTSDAVPEVLEPVAPYLCAWPGTVLAICVPGPVASADALPPTLIDRIVLDRSPVYALERASQAVRSQELSTTFLTPTPQASGDARAFTRRTLRDWGLAGGMWPASLVVNELVTHSILEAATVLDLTLGRVDRQIRIAVHDYGADKLRDTQLDALPDPLEDESIFDRGLLIVRELTRCWGVFPSRVHGKTVWALMEAQRAAA